MNGIPATIKQEFFRYRNGAVADALRRAGDPHTTIFGVEIPRLAEIARMLGPENALAEMLWADRNVRESRILATYLFDWKNMEPGYALELARDVITPEESDMLSFRVLKKLPYAAELYGTLRRLPETAMAARSLARHLY